MIDLLDYGNIIYSLAPLDLNQIEPMFINLL